MADLIVKRAMEKRDFLRRYTVEIDGTYVAYVRAGGTTHIKINEGMRKVRFSIDGYSSKAATILASNQCVAILHCAPAALPTAIAQSDASRFGNVMHLPTDRSL